MVTVPNIYTIIGGNETRTFLHLPLAPVSHVVQQPIHVPICACSIVHASKYVTVVASWILSQIAVCSNRFSSTISSCNLAPFASRTCRRSTNEISSFRVESPSCRTRVCSRGKSVNLELPDACVASSTDESDRTVRARKRLKTRRYEIMNRRTSTALRKVSIQASVLGNIAIAVVEDIVMHCSVLIGK